MHIHPPVRHKNYRENFANDTNARISMILRMKCIGGIPAMEEPKTLGKYLSESKNIRYMNAVHAVIIAPGFHRWIPWFDIHFQRLASIRTVER